MAHLMQPESHSAASVEDEATPTDASRLPTPPLPYDVLLEILGHLGDTAHEECASGLYSSVQFMKKKQAKKALVACSLTSRALRKFTLPHLFRTLKLSFESLQNDYRTTNRPTEEHCCRCLTILDALKFFESHPTLGSYVRELTMTLFLGIISRRPTAEGPPFSTREKRRKPRAIAINRHAPSRTWERKLPHQFAGRPSSIHRRSQRRLS